MWQHKSFLLKLKAIAVNSKTLTKRCLEEKDRWNLFCHSWNYDLECLARSSALIQLSPPKLVGNKENIHPILVDDSWLHDPISLSGFPRVWLVFLLLVVFSCIRIIWIAGCPSIRLEICVSSWLRCWGTD